ncbi:MAG: hypothetical protein U9Q70_13830, partial [Chloroflexota bacterium]|nr:hypothetical protein [Chloroflexota bacterium]
MAQVTLSAYKNEIDQMLEEARYLEAFAHLRHLLSQHPRYSDAYYLLGKMLLDTDQPQLAVDMFRRVLNANPEDILSRIGLGVAYQQLDDAKAALWNFELAFEHDPGNADLAREITQLRGQVNGTVADYVPLSRAGLAQLYLQAGAYRRAGNEMRKILQKQIHRADIMSSLAEAQWRAGEIIQAADVCQDILQDLPYNLKANLLLGTLWVQSGQEEGEYYLNRAQEIDPENHLATQLFGSHSRLTEQEVSLERLVYDPDAIPVDQEAEWFKRIEATSASIGISEIGPEMSAEEMRLVDITTGLESQVQIPDWLQDLGPLGEAGENLDWLELEEGIEGDLAALSTEEVEEEEIITPPEKPESEEIPAWLQEMQTPAGETEPESLFPSEESPLEPAPAATEMPNWLQEMQPAESAEAEITAAAPAAAEEEIPDWLQEIEPTEAITEGEVIAAPEAEEETPDWLRDLRPPAEETASTAPEKEAAMFGWTAFAEEEEEPELPAAEVPAVAEEEIPDWLQEIEPTEAITEGEVIAAPEAEEETPDWLRDLRPPAKETAPTAPEKEAAMFGWTAFAEEEEELELPAAEVPAAAEEEIPDWLQEIEPTEVPQVTAKAAAAPAATEEEEVIAPTAEGEMLSGDDALTWLQSLTAGKEEELRAQAKVEQQARVDEIMGRKRTPPPAEPVAEEAVVVPPPEEVIPAATEEAEVIAPTAEGEMLSGDDALTWLQSLTAGKEEELRAQAKVEQQA